MKEKFKGLHWRMGYLQGIKEKNKKQLKFIQLFISEAFDDYIYKDAVGFKNFLIGRLEEHHIKQDKE